MSRKRGRGTAPKRVKLGRDYPGYIKPWGSRPREKTLLGKMDAVIETAVGLEEEITEALETVPTLPPEDTSETRPGGEVVVVPWISAP